MSKHHHHCSAHGCEAHHVGSCCCSCHECHEHIEEDKGFTKLMLEMADQAWMEVLKEKMKQKIESANGKHLDKLAALVVDANNTRWKGKMEETKSAHDLKTRLADFFNK